MINKTIVISDNIHGLIKLSRIEKEIISTTQFNRLHNINQHSVLYMTFPAVRIKRFEHSIGTMHLTGNLFYYALLNTLNQEENVLKEYLKEAKNYISQIREISKFFQSLDDDIFTEIYNSSEIKNDVYYNEMVFNKIDDYYNGIYLVLLESIRICALLHDIGHPPYSHIVEKSLNAIYYQLRYEATIRLLNDKCSKNNELKNQIQIRLQKDLSKQRDCYYGIAKYLLNSECLSFDSLKANLNNIIKKYKKEEEFDLSKFTPSLFFTKLENLLKEQSIDEDNNKFVINIQQYLSSMIDQMIDNELKKDNETIQNFIKKYTNYKIGNNDLHEEIGIRITEYILNNANSSHTIPDKFYFIVKHVVMSIYTSDKPFFKKLHLLIAGSFETDRLDYVNREQNASGLSQDITHFDRFYNSVRLLKVTNDFYFSFNMKVIQDIDDFFLKRYNSWSKMIYHHRAVKMSELLKNIIFEFAFMLFKNPTNPKFIEFANLWNYLDPTNVTFCGWDDNWLWSTVFKIYSYNNPSIVFDKSLQCKLDELLTNQKKYNSLIKRQSEVYYIKVLFDTKIETEFKKYSDRFNKFKKNNNNSSESIKELEVIFNLSNEMIFRYLISEFLDSSIFGLSFEDFKTYLLDHLSEINRLEDIMITRIFLSSGVEDNIYLHHSYQINETINYKEVSSIDNYIDGTILFFPMFYIYYKNNGSNGSQEYRTILLNSVADAMSQWFISKLSSIMKDLFIM